MTSSGSLAIWRKLAETRSEPTPIILLNRHCVKLLSKLVFTKSSSEKFLCEMVGAVLEIHN